MRCDRLMALTVLLLLTLPQPTSAGDVAELEKVLAAPIIDANLPRQEVENYCEIRILPMPELTKLEEWEKYAQHIRKKTLQHIVFRGKAADWRDAETKVEWLETIEGGPGYKIKKLRYEALPGLWIPALLYEPDPLDGKVPVVMNVNGHDGTGKAADYKQIRCINQAKRGMLALNVEWLGMGQLKTDNFQHYRMNQIDLCGTSGLSPFYLSMKRGLDVLLSLEHADPQRVAVAGLSGGGWQTIVISSLDERVTLSNPVAGYSSFLTRVRNASDLGDSEQTPVDMASIADYHHLTALRAPRPTLLTYNANDNCCFKADHALPPLLEESGPIFELFGKRGNLRSHVNEDPGDHNFELDNRQQLYQMFGDFFFADRSDFDATEIPCDDELKTADELHVEIPDDNVDFHTLAMSLSKNLPRKGDLPTDKKNAKAWQAHGRKALINIVKAKEYLVEEKEQADVDTPYLEGGTIKQWKLQIGGNWTVPVVELSPQEVVSTVIVLADGGRTSAAAKVDKLLEGNHRVLAVDPFYLGESKLGDRDYLMAMLVASVGDRPLGIQASQLAALSEWARERFPGEQISVVAVGPRTSLISLVAAASIGTETIDKLYLHDSMGSLREVIEQNMAVRDAPELFCFGLLRKFDIRQLTALVAPRPVHVIEPSERARNELAGLDEMYEVMGAKFDPLK